jgi:sigma-E factor negative regulatory protein RseB
MLRLRRTSEQVGWILLAVAAATAARAASSSLPHGPRQWLQRMNRALSTLDYDGVFSHWHAGRVETMRIIHRVKDGVITERLVSLDGSGREFIRTGSTLACYLPDKRTVLVEHEPSSLLLGGLPSFGGSAGRYYEFRAAGHTRLIGKPTQLIVVTPKDAYRYGYRLWIDTQTGMPLKTQLCDRRGRVIEQVVFASIRTPSSIPDAAFEPGIATTGFRWVRQIPLSPPAVSAAASSVSTWSAIRLPPGFHLSARTVQVLPGATGVVEHIVYSDGIATVSVFVESRTRSGNAVSGSEQVGSTSAFATTVDGHPVTALGEVPPATVKIIANSVKAGPPAAP